VSAGYLHPRALLQHDAGHGERPQPIFEVAFSDEFLGTGVEIMNRMSWIAAAVAACAASISPSQAFTDADLDRLAAEILESKTAPGVGDAINDLSSELIECSAITMVSAICIGKTPGQDSNAGQPLENISSWTGKLGVILGSGVGLSERALSTRLKVTADDIMRDVSSSCRNLSVLFERVRKSCEALVASPTNRLKQILVARQPSLYGK